MTSRGMLALILALSACKPSQPPSPPPQAPVPAPGPVAAPPPPREADPEPHDLLISDEGALLSEEHRGIEAELTCDPNVSAPRVLDAIAKTRAAREPGFLGPLFKMSRTDRPAIATAAREALESIIGSLQANVPLAVSCEPEVSLILRVRTPWRSPYCNVRKPIRAELTKAGIKVVRPGQPPPALMLMADLREEEGSPYDALDAPSSPFLPRGPASATSVKITLDIWLIDVKNRRVMGWLSLSAHERPAKARAGELHGLSAAALARSVAQARLDGYVLAALGRREALSEVLLSHGLTDNLRALAEAVAFQPETPAEKARFHIAERRYAECGRLGKAGLEMLLPVYHTLKFRDERGELDAVTGAILSVGTSDLLPALRELVNKFPWLHSTTFGDVLQGPSRILLRLMERLADIGEPADAALVAKWADSKWGADVATAARRAKIRLEGKR